MNYKFTCAYDGTHYHGWQRQPRLPTVQGETERAFAAVFGIDVTATGCGRTDGGVHAREYVFNAVLPPEITAPPQALVRALNGRLPRDIAVLSCAAAPDDFHARFSAKGKEYVYRVYVGNIRDPFSATRALHYPRTADITKMNAAAELLTGEHDFAAYCAAEAVKRLDNTVRVIYECRVSQSDEMIEIRVSGGGFLYNMVRIIAGTLLEVSEGKLTLSDIRSSLTHPDRTKTGRTLPPHGLYLNKVYY